MDPSVQEKSNRAYVVRLRDSLAVYPRGAVARISLN